MANIVNLLTIPTKNRAGTVVNAPNTALAPRVEVPNLLAIPTASMGRITTKPDTAVKAVAYPSAYIIGF